MKYLDEYRDAGQATKLLHAIRRRATRQWTIMEVCGGQTHNLLRHGIESSLEGIIELVHGPGCPVCVTPIASIDQAQTLAHLPDVILASFGDMLRVPGSQGSLLQARAAGANVRVVYGPSDAVQLAKSNPDKSVIFFAVGFETTAPATALAVQQAACENVDNFYLLVAHVRVLPAMEAVAGDPGNRVQAFLAAGHVCAITGYQSYEPFAQKHRLPVVVTGFEPVDLLDGILAAVCQLETARHLVENRYARTVRRAGNRAARTIVEDVFEVCDRPWRGFGTIKEGGFRLRDAWRRFDAADRFAKRANRFDSPRAPSKNAHCASHLCKSADVLAGRIKPPDCSAFGTSCTPESPLGAPMVSTEGACAAYYKYRSMVPNEPDRHLPKREASKTTARQSQISRAGGSDAR